MVLRAEARPHGIDRRVAREPREEPVRLAGQRDGLVLALLTRRARPSRRGAKATVVPGSRRSTGGSAVERAAAAARATLRLASRPSRPMSASRSGADQAPRRTRGTPGRAPPRARRTRPKSAACSASGSASPSRSSGPTGAARRRGRRAVEEVRRELEERGAGELDLDERDELLTAVQSAGRPRPPRTCRSTSSRRRRGAPNRARARDRLVERAAERPGTPECAARAIVEEREGARRVQPLGRDADARRDARLHPLAAPPHRPRSRPRAPRRRGSSAASGGRCSTSCRPGRTATRPSTGATAGPAALEHGASARTSPSSRPAPPPRAKAGDRGRARAGRRGWRASASLAVRRPRRAQGPASGRPAARARARPSSSAIARQPRFGTSTGAAMRSARDAAWA